VRGKRTSWSTFRDAHWESIAATDIFTLEVLTLRGLVTHHVLFVLDLASRTVKIVGIATHPHEQWMMQMARNLTDVEEPFLRRARFLIVDRDTQKYSQHFAQRSRENGLSRSDCHRGPKFECIRGEIRAFGKGRVHRSHDLSPVVSRWNARSCSTWRANAKNAIMRDCRIGC
jgi:hypothetical protein